MRRVSLVGLASRFVGLNDSARVLHHLATFG